jgi:hypothetical protein
MLTQTYKKSGNNNEISKKVKEGVIKVMTKDDIQRLKYDARRIEKE